MLSVLRSALLIITTCATGCGGSQAAGSQAAGSQAAGSQAASTISPTRPVPPGEMSAPPVIAPAVNKNAKTLFIHDKTVQCQGEGPMTCLQVRESATGAWEWFYSPIEGFDYEEGNRYELRVEITEVKNPPADASSLRYRLIEIVSKAKVN